MPAGSGTTGLECGRSENTTATSPEFPRRWSRPIGRQQFREKMLITHRGLSGPAILQISSYWDGRQPIAIDLAPGREVAVTPPRCCAPRLCGCESRTASGSPSTVGGAVAATCISRSGGRMSNSRTWIRQLHRWEIRPSGTEGYEKAEVTAGGVNTDELSARTMECTQSAGPVSSSAKS